MTGKQAKYMLDTNICIYIQKQRPESVLKKFQALKPGDVVISTITWGELQYGAAKSQNKQKILTVLDAFSSLVPVVAMSSETGSVYGRMRAVLAQKGTPIGNNDLWIAAHAKTLNLTLVTNNTKEFERIPTLKLENWVLSLIHI